jgi:hypothetical protein
MARVLRVRKAEHPHLHKHGAPIPNVPARQLFEAFLYIRKLPEHYHARIIEVLHKLCGHIPLSGAQPPCTPCADVPQTEADATLRVLREFLAMRSTSPPRVIGLQTITHQDAIQRLQGLKPTTRAGYQRALNSLSRGDWLRYAPIPLVEPGTGNYRVEVARAMRHTLKSAGADAFRTHRAVIKLVFQ